MQITEKNETYQEKVMRKRQDFIDRIKSIPQSVNLKDVTIDIIVKQLNPNVNYNFAITSDIDVFKDWAILTRLNKTTEHEEEYDNTIGIKLIGQIDFGFHIISTDENSVLRPAYIEHTGHPIAFSTINEKACFNANKQDFYIVYNVYIYAPENSTHAAKVL